MTIRRTMCWMLDHALRRRLAPFRSEDWTSSAVVIAPHPDDETLGCGGVISKKIAAGAMVRLVFVTDGSASHAIEAGPDALGRLRAEEALEAARRLGVRADRVTFLNSPDGRAAEHLEEITGSLVDLMRAWRPECVYVVHGCDPPSDHRAAFAALTRAIRAYGEPLTVFEYPVWYWYHWPWIAVGGDLPGMWRKNLAQTARTAAGLRSLSRLNARADVSDAMDMKLGALAAHRTQTARPDGRPDWPVLRDLGRGDFLARLTSDYEAFTRYDVNG
jgi:LmbE family N-acetylglucosaminyl deacetylase